MFKEGGNHRVAGRRPSDLVKSGAEYWAFLGLQRWQSGPTKQTKLDGRPSFTRVVKITKRSRRTYPPHLNCTFISCFALFFLYHFMFPLQMFFLRLHGDSTTYFCMECMKLFCYCHGFSNIEHTYTVY